MQVFAADKLLSWSPKHLGQINLGFSSSSVLDAISIGPEMELWQQYARQFNHPTHHDEKMLLLTGLCNQSGVKCKDSGAEEVEILSDSIQELT